MRLESLSLRGILRFADTVTLDFKDLPPGLIAIVGSNGAGKTTLMEAPLACLYRQFPSRNREAFDYATRSDAFIETAFELEGRGLYRARLALDGPHRKAEAVLSQVLPDGRTVFLNDGKVSTYDTAILAILPRFDDLLASVFAAQNKVGSFSGLDKKGRRELFASLLGLDHYEEWAERARGAAAAVTLAVDRASATRDALARDAGIAVEQALDAEAQRLQVDLGTVESRRADLERLMRQAETDLGAVQSDLSVHAAAVTRRDHLNDVLRGTRIARQTVLDGLTRLDADAGDERGRLNVALSKTLARLDTEARSTHVVAGERAQIEEARAAAVTDAQERISLNESLLSEAESIRGAATTVAEMDNLLASLRGKQQAVQQQIDAIVAQHGMQQTARQKVAGLVAELARAEHDSALLARVPCGGEGEYAVCPVLTSAQAAAARIPDLADAREQLAAIDAQIGGLDKQHHDLKSMRAGLVKDIAQHGQTKAMAQATADDLPHLERAETKIEGHRKAILQAEMTAVEALAAADSRERGRQERIASDRATRQQEHVEALAAMDARVADQRTRGQAEATRIDAEIAQLVVDIGRAQHEADATKDAAEQARTEQAKLTTYRAEWDQSTSRLATVEAQVADLTRRRLALETRRAELDAIEARIEALRTDLIEWSVLAKAMGRDGLPTIEIDQAGPTVSAYANDLLRACFGGRFTIELVTQAPKTTKGKDGSTHKEVFDANIYDQQRAGEERKIEDLSGGERVIVEEVLRSAIALLVNQKHQQPIRTIWRDETTGALDPENAERYIAMLRRLQEIGGFHHVLFVTHSDDCARLADAQIRVDDGAYAIALPPFVGEAVLA